MIENDKLFGRGSSNDGYSIFAAIATIKACQGLGLPHPRYVITIKADEESESKDGASGVLPGPVRIIRMVS